MSDPTKSERAWLVLADGTTFEGRPFGAREATAGEAVFTTALTGYQEIISDPSYCDQIVVMTTPHIGNVGMNRQDHESTSAKPSLAGLVVRDRSTLFSNWRAEHSLDQYLCDHGIAGITEVDTRKLTRHLRDHGTQNGAFGCQPPEQLLEIARKAPNPEGLNLVHKVTCSAPYAWTEGNGLWALPFCKNDLHVVVLDLGVKRNLLRSLVDMGCRVTVVPAFTSGEEILSFAPDGILLSNGPGDPAVLEKPTETIRFLLGKKPIFGVCLGHQLLTQALKGKTYKLKFGHRGCNQPVRDKATGRIEITSQNHGFCVDLQSLPSDVISTHIHLNDGTSEGLAVPSLKTFSVQYHPEASAGPHDSLYLFHRFSDLMTSVRP
ncbi:glutamine-hydrolyzing carbamoyl-phosphate synthase small subunit [Pajaroellobacter abortibovis]|uniref:Carbamoyl phosphate synthase small chain n=1 Tax=Pajaroellobacter abortibovis TaxID=1882918 RepID=A0A1L6MXE1_9BACT|nr:glutamine-hydrolyzing carbamoyl-phosphate synthase small subunit [Pajaroellobacter abortibovis]APS00172.1 carbamoyl phosphate synthase small subunit [Pajaroellobacter abortibovis]